MLGGKLTLGKVIFIGAELFVLVMANVLAYYLLQPSSVWYLPDSSVSSCDAKYESYPTFSGKISDIEVMNYIEIRNDVDSNLNGNDQYKKADSADIGMESITTARIRITGAGGDKWFIANTSTYVYDNIANMYCGISISKGQQITVCYGKKAGIEGYDYVYAVKGVGLNSVSSSGGTGHNSVASFGGSGFVFVALIPGVLIFIFSLVLMVFLSTPKEERSHGAKGMIALSVVMITLAVLFSAGMLGVIRYIRLAQRTTTRIRAHAPIIYLYPEEETSVNVKLSLDGNLTTTYPLYDDSEGWNVTASPDGLLTDIDGRNYSYLFWEADLDMIPDMSRGFCVKGEDTAAFLECALKESGLSDTEANAFIMYWLPQMEINEYNVITFQVSSYEDAAALEICPAPDTVIRVNMLWYPSNSYVELEPQDLGSMNPSERTGFTVVEWGGEKYGE